MNDRDKIIFFAYGTNIAQKEMLSHCENSVLLGYGKLLDYELHFQGYKRHGVASVSKKRGAELPVAIYEMQPEGRFTIDNFEKFPYKYKRVKAVASFNGEKIKGQIYVLKQRLPDNMPSEAYIRSLKSAYWEADFDATIIDKALAEIKE